MEAVVKKWGNSKAIILPEEFAERESVEFGDKVEIIIVGKRKVSAFGIFKGARPFVREDHLEREF